MSNPKVGEETANITEKSPEASSETSPTFDPAEAEMQVENSRKTVEDTKMKGKHFGEEPGLLKDLLKRLKLRNLRSLLSDFSVRLGEINADVGDIISKQEKVAESVERAAQERDEVIDLIDILSAQLMEVPETSALMKERLKPSIPAEDLSRLRVSVKRIQCLIEQVSDQLLTSIEECNLEFRKAQSFEEMYSRSVVSQQMFSGFENENFMLRDGALPILYLDTGLRNESHKKFMAMNDMRSSMLLQSEDALFAQFVFERKAAILSQVRKALTLLPRDSFLPEPFMDGDIDERLEDLAKEVWAMHKLSLSMKWRPRILRVQTGAPFDETLMEAVNSPRPDDEHGVKRARYVECMVMPGFAVLDTLVSPCRVYLL